MQKSNSLTSVDDVIRCLKINTMNLESTIVT